MFHIFLFPDLSLSRIRLRCIPLHPNFFLRFFFFFLFIIIFFYRVLSFLRSLSRDLQPFTSQYFSSARSLINVQALCLKFSIEHSGEKRGQPGKTCTRQGRTFSACPETSKRARLRARRAGESESGADGESGSRSDGEPESW